MMVLDIKNKPNEHGYLYLKCLIAEEINFDSVIKASTEDEIYVYEEQDQGVSNPITNSKGISYPEVNDLKTGKPMEFPGGDLARVPKDERAGWYRNQSEANLYRENDTDILCKKDFIDEWYKRGYSDPTLYWKEYDIHHITPREFGGEASFENLTPLERATHQSQVTPWWNAYNK